MGVTRHWKCQKKFHRYYYFTLGAVVAPFYCKRRGADMWFALEIHFQNTKNKMYLYWRSTDFNTLYLTVKDKETGEKKKYKYSGISFRNTETLNRVLEGYGFTKENTFAKVTLFITVSRTMEILDGKMEIKNKRCYWCYRTCNGVDIRSSSWRKSIVKGRTIYDMVSAVDALLYKTEKIHILS